MSSNILIIDDDKRLRELLEDYLLEKKFFVYLCDDFISAKEILEYFLFDLIIIDRMMPTGDGIDLIKIIKEKNPTPIIMLTAMGESANKIEGLKFGADDYLAKPFEPEELYLRIVKLLDLFKQNSKQNNIITFGNFLYNLKGLKLIDFPVYKNRHGGYTRNIKLNNRKNDNAPVSMLEFIDITPETNEVDDAVEETTEAVAE